MFKIYYTDGSVVEGSSKQNWLAAPDTGVQVVAVLQSPPTSENLPDRLKTGYVHCGRKDRMLFTGVDWFDPLNFGHLKEGELMSDEDYFAIWDRAYGDR